MSDPATTPRVRVRAVSKRFGSTVALDDVSLDLRAGEVHALMGENGAGKSTLGKVLAGLVRPDAGEVEVDGRRLRAGSLEAAHHAGVRLVHQELAQCPNLSVAENLCLGRLPRRGCFVDTARMHERARALVHRLDPTIDVTRVLGELSPGRRQLCQVAAALDDDGGNGSGARVIVFDEPTSSLSLAEAERLMRIVRQIAASGITAVFVSHRMSEIFACCDRVSVLRDGRLVQTSDVRAIDEPTLVEQMLGRRIETDQGVERTPGGEVATLRAMARDQGNGHHERPLGDVVLEVERLTSPGRLRGVSLQVRAGEVVGIGGLVGAGRSDLLDAIFGVDTRRRGPVRVCGRVPPGNPRAAIAAGVGYVPEDRRVQGLFFNLGIDENILVPIMPDLGRAGVRSIGREKDVVRARVKALGIKAAALDARPDHLSGGNQQKLLIARWMHAGTRVLLLDEPTRGIDVGTKAEIHRMIRHAAREDEPVIT
ncbi:MAG: sugar ABC transporter ATP-binding protein [Phycisphaerales bacterium]